MADILSGRFGRAVQALFNLNTPATLGQVLPDVFPVINLEQPRPELELFSGNDLCVGTSEITGAALQFPQVSIGFPATPTPERLGPLLVVNKIVLAATGTTAVSMSFGSVAAHNTTTTVSKRDTRRFTQMPYGVVRNNSAAAVPDRFARFTVVSGTPLTIEEPFVLCPVVGSFEQAGLILTGETAVSTLRVTFFWRERPFGQQESTS